MRGQTAIALGAIFCMYVYGSIVYSTRDSVYGYHDHWPPKDNCDGTMMIENNPQHHPNHCWPFLEHPANTSYFPNPNNGSYPSRQRKTDGSPIFPYSTATSYAYLVFALALVGIERRYHRFDVGGIALSLLWVTAASAELHGFPSSYTRQSDWHVVGPLLTWVGVDAMQFADMWVMYMLKLILVCISIQMGYRNEAASLYYSAGVLVVGYVFVYHARMFRQGLLERSHFWDAVTVFLFFFTSVVCKVYGGSADAMLESIQGAFPSTN